MQTFKQFHLLIQLLRFRMPIRIAIHSIDWSFNILFCLSLGRKIYCSHVVKSVAELANNNPTSLDIANAIWKIIASFQQYYQKESF